MVSPRDVRELDETLDVAETIRGKFKLLAGRTTKETQEGAKFVADAAETLAARVRGLKEHIERNEDIA